MSNDLILGTLQPTRHGISRQHDCSERHEESDTRATMHKSGGGPAPADPKQEARLLDREMSTLESIDLQKIEADLAARRSALSPFAVPIDRTANGAAMRGDCAPTSRNLPPMERLAAMLQR